MKSIDFAKINREMDAIANNYIHKITSFAPNCFCNRYKSSTRDIYHGSHGFQVLYEETNHNAYNTVEREEEFEGYTRCYLINPIIKVLLNCYGIENEWFSKGGGAWMSNREYETKWSFIEFVAVLNGEKVGFRHTPFSYDSSELGEKNIDRDFEYLTSKSKIPGFEKLSPVNKFYAIDWSGISEKDLSQIHKTAPGCEKLNEDISVRDFFNLLFPEMKYEDLESVAKKAIKKAREIFTLKTIPQLYPSNILEFKETLLDDFTEEKVKLFHYEFANGQASKELSQEDIANINNKFFGYGYRESIIGSSDFSKSFVTSEYLFNVVKDGLGIDYTSVVVGYLKAVEQLLYVLYVSAFEGLNGMEYWDRYRDKVGSRKNNFDISQPQYRLNPYNEKWKQEKYYHKIKKGKPTPDIGELILFLRYFDKAWNISENGKEFVYRCLDDFRDSCRNSRFHKDNIEYTEYKEVLRIRNNAKVCLYYLLGGFKLLDSNKSVEDQLGIEDYSFERLYRKVHPCRAFWVKSLDGYEGVVYYLIGNYDVQYDASGMPPEVKMKFLKLPTMKRDDVHIEEIEQTLKDSKYVEENTIIITRETMPSKIEPIKVVRPKLKRRP